MKNKETLEEAARRIFGDDEDRNYLEKRAFIKGAKWQQEKLYSEEEVKNLFRKYQYDLAQWILRMEDDINSRPIPTEWFEQFKNK